MSLTKLLIIPQYLELVEILQGLSIISDSSTLDLLLLEFKNKEQKTLKIILNNTNVPIAWIKANEKKIKAHPISNYADINPKKIIII